MDRDAAIERHRGALMSFVRLIGGGAGTSRVLEPDGVTASVVPAIPNRSIVNSVAYRDAQSLEAAMDDLAGAYEDAGVTAWTVWVPEDDRDAAALLEASGHRLDATPTAMMADLTHIADADPSDDLDWGVGANPPDVGRINDLAYGWPEGTFVNAMDRFGDLDALRLYEARAGGEPVCVLGTYDNDDDCEVYFVATLPDHRGRGLARRLTRCALNDARDRGLAFSSRQATKMGYPIYERLGYEPICTLEMWERRGS
jgi:ribosomal protein S18 acetylase RimI-like enzyme